MQYRKKPVVIDAEYWTGANLTKMTEFIGEGKFSHNPETDELIIPTLEGDHRASLGDVIIRGVKGEYYPCKPDIFAATYDPA